ncbi:hypothetical protein T265_13915, partial [Opisthorchis viverrini]
MLPGNLMCCTRSPRVSVATIFEISRYTYIRNALISCTGQSKHGYRSHIPRSRRAEPPPRGGSLDVCLGELRVQQLQTGPTTPFGFNVLVTFDNVYYESSGASAPVPTSTQESLVGFTCEECGKCCKSKAGFVAHHRVHDNGSVGTNTVAQLACADCSRLFPTKIGLSQHRRHAHPTQHNADKLGRVKYSSTRWSQQESQSLLRLANNLYPSCGTQTELFTRLEQYFPGRSAISIKTRLRVLNWQAQQDETSSGEPEQTISQTTAYSSEADDYSVWFKQTVDCTVSLLKSHADRSLASVDLLAFPRGLQSGIMTPEQVLSLLNLHASRTFPHTWKTELRTPTSTSFIKPDLIAVREHRATIIDVSIVSDGRGVIVWNGKKQKYGADEHSLAIISALHAIGCDIDFLVHQPMIISYRRICFPQSAKAVIGLGFPKVAVSDLCLLAIVGSLRTYDTFMRGTWR